MTDLLPLIAVLPALWLLLVEPELEQRRKRRAEARLAAWLRDLSLGLIAARAGRDGLRRVLLNDLKQLCVMRMLREEGFTIDMALEVLR